MSTDVPALAPPENVGELLERLGGIPPERVLLQPPPGKATERDLIATVRKGRYKLLELVDGVFVEKAVGTREALMGGLVFHLLMTFVRANNLGKLLPGDALIRLLPGLIRGPDVSFFSWDRLGGKFPDEPIASVVPDLAIELLSKGNTRAEIDRKIRELFLAGTRLVWVIDPKKRNARVYTTPDEVEQVPEGGTLDGGDVLPGFTLSLREVFDEADEGPPA